MPSPRRLSHAALAALAALLLGGWGRCGSRVPSASSFQLPPRPAGTFPADYRLAWSDEFDGPAGTLPDATKWSFDVGGGGWGNNQLEYDTDRAQNASQDGQGHLAIVARQETFGNRGYTSARIKTAGKLERAYGRFEARIKLPPGKGLWPAFWLLGADIGEVGWPTCGEIDVMEYLGQFTNTALSTVHGPGYSGGQGIGKAYGLPSGSFDQGFHVFAVEWDPYWLVFSIDGQEFLTVTPSSPRPLSPEDWVFDHPFFVILNLAVGGNLPGSPDGSTPFPATMLVDYVRVYERVTP